MLLLSSIVQLTKSNFTLYKAYSNFASWSIIALQSDHLKNYSFIFGVAHSLTMFLIFRQLLLVHPA